MPAMLTTLRRVSDAKGLWARGRGAMLRPGPARVFPLAAVVLAIQCSPALQDALAFDRSAVAAGEFWRLLTCHLTHWSWPHLAGDLSGLLGLLWLLHRHEGTAWVTCAATAVLAGLAVWLFCPIDSYRGLSAIDHALLLLAILRADLARAFRLPLLLLTLAKVALEYLAPALQPGTGLPPGIATVPLAHAVGLAVGGILAICTTRPTGVNGAPTA